ncbi:glycoside hydrolase [Nocardioides sp. GY 10113]|uniref:glycoside hydrolase family 3 N-terminal domain-containing protein n=1 Tax=Nocardioides sp. GY 10113 TaxID=2569761 RepID=UPI0010A78371|nr:glycoside hydrolase family 3 N-terminal domain-containing protein [Nocardioides sp. GY 10113]TIC85807.1 glycoside hydrolase [Nocardioides sp. GY 10113]
MTAPSAEALALRVLLASFAGPTLPAEWRDLLADGLGGVCLFGSNLTGTRAETAALVDAVRSARPGALVAVDEEGGDVTRLHTGTASPVLGAAVLGAVDDVDLTEATGRAVGDDLAALGIDLDLGPVADVNSHPDNPVIGTRSFGATPDLVARHVAAWVRGVQSAGVAACVKHFPGHGDTAQDSHLTLPVLDADAETLATRELPPFAAAIGAGAASVMTSHLVVPALDPDRPATFSAPILDRLRALGFDGAIVSDALDMAGASGEGAAGRGIAEAAVLALGAGADLLCVGPDKDAALIREIQASIVAAVADGRLPLARLRDAAGRVDRLRVATPGTSQAGATIPAVPDPGRVRAAARGALIAEGTLPDLRGAVVVSVDTPANIAVGAGRWGVEPDLVVAPGEPVPDGHGPLVVQVRDAHRRPEIGAMLAAARPALVVEWGWPGPRTGWSDEGPERPPARICTRGNAAPVIAAVEELMREAGWDR